MQFVLIIYHGTFPLPGTPEAKLISEEEQKAIYADYATLNEMENMTPGPPLGLPENATTVRVENGSTVTTEGPYLGVRDLAVKCGTYSGTRNGRPVMGLSSSAVKAGAGARCGGLE